MIRRPTRLAAAATLTLALAGCASADKTGQTAAAPSTNSSAGSAGSAVGSSGMAAGSAGSMSMNTATIVNADGVAKPVPIRTIGTGVWKDMDITAQEMTPVPFYLDEGTHFKEVKPTKSTTFHLMVMLTDRHTGEPIPYSNVWATITEHGKPVYNQTQWAMDAEYMGPHYGNNVALPGPGTYRLTVFVSPPKAAMHVQYAGMWTGVHTLTSTFTWK